MTTLIADTISGFRACQLEDLPPDVELLDPDDFMPSIDTLEDGETIAATFDDADERLTWIDAEYGIHGWRDDL